MPRAASLFVVLSIASALAGCTSASNPGGVDGVEGSGDGTCESRYENVAVAHSRKALNRALIEDVPGGRLRLQGTAPASGDRDISADIVDVLDERGRRVMQIDVFRQPDGRWFGGEWWQCID